MKLTCAFCPALKSRAGAAILVSALAISTSNDGLHLHKAAGTQAPLSQMHPAISTLAHRQIDRRADTDTDTHSHAHSHNRNTML